jgi:hypothetical protein
LKRTVYTIKENIEALIDASKGIGLEVNAEKRTISLKGCGASGANADGP